MVISVLRNTERQKLNLFYQFKRKYVEAFEWNVSVKDSSESKKKKFRIVCCLAYRSTHKAFDGSREKWMSQENVKDFTYCC